MTKKLFVTTILFSFFACTNTKDENKSSDLFELNFAKNITIQETNNSLIIESNGNKTVFLEAELPISKIMVETTAAIAYLDELEAISTIRGVVDADYIYNTKIGDKIAHKSILEIGNSNELYVETILKHRPQLIIASSNPTLAKYHEQLEQNGVKILYIDEYKENDPLGRLEYIKVFGKILKKDQLAKSKFENTSNKYDSIKTIIQSKGTGNVSTLVNSMYGDIWYLPPGNALQAKLIEDAKGNYIYHDETGKNALNLTFEEVYAAGKNATHWINPTYENLAQMKAAYPNYIWFDAYKNGEIYNSNKRSLPNGAQDYYETGIVRPDIILNDLGKIFYPNLFPNYELYFYQQLK
ncbi:ABC transporter substrate-binding protein [Faecalibacter rhinopitheci]|uniref:ABC transporter substrate-binding protein n=1 Tax=Faecalibacter rhinopitheci TaxID=2779678 RepID=A0A8J7FWA7_9FLAO|nr:ABC transporter substrate-binding protein [Faecalibacter rhinopitheci]MBF0597731.1 ABC transporter substrate-binding protein [Faecalibacter rhinopitheci]